MDLLGFIFRAILYVGLPLVSIVLIVRDARARGRKRVEIILWAVCSVWIWFLTLPAYFFLAWRRDWKAGVGPALPGREKALKVAGALAPGASFVLNLLTLLNAREGDLYVLLVPLTMFASFLTLPFGVAAVFMKKGKGMRIAPVSLVASVLLCIIPTLVLVRTLIG